MGRKKKTPSNTTSNQEKINGFSSKLIIRVTVVLSIVLAIGIHWIRTLKAHSLSDYIGRRPLIEKKKWNVECSNQYQPFVHGCHRKKDQCGRVLQDSFISKDEVFALREIAEKGMAFLPNEGGPTIMDINSGYVMGGKNFLNLYEMKKDRNIFEPKDYALYRKIIERIRNEIMKEFQLETLYSTAPTFISRIVGNSTWKPKEANDEYWQPHADKNNIGHFDFSGLLYLSDYELEFTGGLFAFIDHQETIKKHIEPTKGRLLMFTSGKENLHQVEKVTSGTRYVMSLWFTCDERHQFHNFLDGKAHKHYN